MQYGNESCGIAALADLVSIKTGKLNSNAAVENGAYPFFTCSRETYKVDTYSFDCEAVLLAGNNANGVYPVKYYKGRFDAYQRTYVIRSVDEDVLNNRYLFYALQLELDLLQSLSTGSATKFLTLTILNALKVRVPSLSDQNRIVSILGAYDDLIENNTRRIEILEEMARRLYEEWFVQFRFPGHEGVVFEDDVPQGWSRVRLDSVAEVNPEAISPKNAPDEIMYVDISSVSTRQVNKLQRLEFSEAPGRARRKVISGDVVWSCVRPALRSYALIIDPPPNTIVSTGFAVVRADSVPFSYLYQVLGSDQFVSYLDNHATGAAYPAVKASDFEVAEVVLPCKNLLAQFDGAVLPMLKMIHVLRLKNNNLQSQRDLLLPKLISGEIDVSDIPMPT
ncbi:restriction endonuclease subunit S [Pseudomonas guariconensis]|uniref:restriction endonuclease subunit S n=1 Tax=Pseudomonas guariconensis TaxID=1288410 RepID=UPI0018A92CFA|nr:restriction endonuclease subunit S [Pseudomonas guariconensis]MBF8755661.1 restriction endonuclease subunit S [Pseudomonas guariconensis]